MFWKFLWSKWPAAIQRGCLLAGNNRCPLHTAARLVVRVVAALNLSVSAMYINVPNLARDRSRHSTSNLYFRVILSCICTKSTATHEILSIICTYRIIPWLRALLGTELPSWILPVHELRYVRCINVCVRLIVYCACACVCVCNCVAYVW